MLNLYLDGKLDDYNRVFDVEYFTRHKEDITLWAILAGHDKMTDMEEITQMLRDRGDVTRRIAIRYHARLWKRRIKHILKCK